MADLDINDIASEIQAAANAGLIDRATADLALGTMRDTYANLTAPPKNIRDAKMQGANPKLKVLDATCILCGSKTILDTQAALKPCLTCGAVNTG